MAGGLEQDPICRRNLQLAQAAGQDLVSAQPLAEPTER
jgi:hypothetical protein